MLLQQLFALMRYQGELENARRQTDRLPGAGAAHRPEQLELPPAPPVFHAEHLRRHGEDPAKVEKVIDRQALLKGAGGHQHLQPPQLTAIPFLACGVDLIEQGANQEQRRLTTEAAAELIREESNGIIPGCAKVRE